MDPHTLLLGMEILSYTKEGFTKLKIEAKHVAVISFTSMHIQKKRAS